MLVSLAPPGPLTYLIGMSRDKNAPGFLRALRVPERAGVMLTTFSGHRAMALADLSHLADEVGLSAQTCPDLGQAIGRIAERRQGKGLVVATGSLHMAAQTREQLGLLSNDLLAEARAHLDGETSLEEVRFVLFGEPTYRVFEMALDAAKVQEQMERLRSRKS